jgi:prepilin-type N-terminal cleavage/methylation domain-containing protein
MILHHSRRTGFTLIELVVVCSIIGVLIGLLLPAVMRVREAANRTICGNNFHQVALAFHHCDENRGRMPPGIGYFPASGYDYGTALYFILPYLEQDPLYQHSRNNGFYFVGNNEVAEQSIKAFVCPSDPTAGNGVVLDNQGRKWGASTLACNAQVFARVNQVTGEFISPQGEPRLTAIFHGTSNTILLAEKLSRCRNNAYPEGGSLWGYWLARRPFVQPLHAGFAISWQPYDVGPQSVFLVAPNPTECDPTLASTPHRGGMIVALADGSVRTLSPSISGTTWWAACTPYSLEPLGNDW